MIAGLKARVRSIWRGLRRRPDVEAEMSEEFRLHQELRAEDLMRSGMSPAEARRQARLDFGPPARYEGEGRESRGLHRVDQIRFSWLDIKLGFRMLVRYPGLTIVGGLAFAFAIWLGAAGFEFVTRVVHPTLPLPGGENIVGLQNWDAASNDVDRQVLNDLARWRTSLTSVEDLGAFRIVRRNLVTGEGRGEPLEIAEIHASAFRVARIPPMLGRPLVEEDEHPGATPVLLIGYDVWQRRFAGDSAIVGSTVRLGRTGHTIVGVMPEGFGFPVANDAWTPLQVDPLQVAPRQGPAVQVFGRLVPGASLAGAQTELAALGTRAAGELRETHEHLRPQVLPYAKSIYNVSTEEMALLLSGNIPMLLLLVLLCGNVALLMYARAATRAAELVVRPALGASRGRIVMQLFAEALALGIVAAVVGLAATGFALRWGYALLESSGASMPFWFDDRLSPTTYVYAALLTLIGAAIAGIVPALKVTSGVGARLREATAGGGGLRFGGVWTAIIVTQIALTVAFPALAYYVKRDASRMEAVDTGVPRKDYLTLRVEMDREPPPGAPADTTPAAFMSRFQRTYGELARRLTDDPAVVSVASAERLPLMYHPHRLMDVDSGGAAPLRAEWPAYRVSSARVDPDFFTVFDAAAIAGRTFHSGDVTPDDLPIGVAGAEPGVVVVNESFVRLVLGGRNPIGRRIRYVSFEDREPRTVEDVEDAPWYE